MHIYEVDLEPAEPDGFAAMVPAVPGLLVLDSDVNEVLRRVRVAIVEREGCGLSRTWSLRATSESLAEQSELAFGQEEVTAVVLLLP
jgi:hypothetical protein